MEGTLMIEGKEYPIYNDGVAASLTSAKAIEEVYNELDKDMFVMYPTEEGIIRVCLGSYTEFGDGTAPRYVGNLVGFVDYEHSGQMVVELHQEDNLKVFSMNGVESQDKVVPITNLKWGN